MDNGLRALFTENHAQTCLLDKPENFLKRRMLRRPQPLKRDYLGRHQLGAGARQPVKCSVAVAFAAGAAGVDHDPDFKIFFEQIERDPHQAYMRFAACDDDSAAPLLLFGSDCLQVPEQLRALPV